MGFGDLGGGWATVFAQCGGEVGVEGGAELVLYFLVVGEEFETPGCCC